MPLWVWIALGALVILVIVEELRIFHARREFRRRDEIFQVVTENAADMIALVDVKGRACTTVLRINVCSATLQRN